MLGTGRSIRPPGVFSLLTVRVYKWRKGLLMLFGLVCLSKGGKQKNKSETKNMNQTEKNKMIREVMENFPEASQGNALYCRGCNYKKMKFLFSDDETGKTHEVNMEMLQKGFDKFVETVNKGEFFCCGVTPTLLGENRDWDGCCSDGLVQCAIFGKVIYG